MTTPPKIEQVWLRRNDAQLGMQKLEGLDKQLVIMFGYERRPLGFSLKLAEFQKDTKPDSKGNTAWISRIDLSPGKQKLDDLATNKSLREVTTNRPLQLGNLTIFQEGLQRTQAGVEMSVLRVTSDPGRPLKLWGAAICCGGILLVCVHASPDAVRYLPLHGPGLPRKARGTNTVFKRILRNRLRIPSTRQTPMS